MITCQLFWCYYGGAIMITCQLRGAIMITCQLFCWKLCALSYSHHRHHGLVGHRGGCAMRMGFPTNHVASYAAYYWYEPFTYFSKQLVSRSQTHVTYTQKNAFHLLAFLATNHLTCGSYPRYGKYPLGIIDSTLVAPPLGHYHNPFVIFPVAWARPYIN